MRHVWAANAASNWSTVYAVALLEPAVAVGSSCSGRTPWHRHCGSVAYLCRWCLPQRSLCFRRNSGSSATAPLEILLVVFGVCHLGSPVLLGGGWAKRSPSPRRGGEDARSARSHAEPVAGNRRAIPTETGEAPLGGPVIGRGRRIAVGRHLDVAGGSLAVLVLGATVRG